MEMEKMSKKQAIRATENNMMSQEELEESIGEVWEEILDFALWEFSFEVHRAAKLDYLHLDPALDPNWDENEMRAEASKDDLGQQKTDLVCPKCQKEYTIAKFLGEHLPICMGLKRSSRRKKAQRSDTKCGTSDNAGKKTSQKSRGRKKSKSNDCGNSSKSFEGDDDIFKIMTYGEIEKFLLEKCGVLKGSKRCMNSLKCAQHSHDSKELVRQAFSKNPGDNAGSDQMNQSAVKSDLRGDIP